MMNKIEFDATVDVSKRSKTVEEVEKLAQDACEAIAAFVEVLKSTYEGK